MPSKKGKAPPYGLTTLILAGDLPRDLDVVQVARDPMYRSTFVQIGHLDLEQWLVMPPETVGARSLEEQAQGIVYTTASVYGDKWAIERTTATEHLLDALDELHSAAKQRAIMIMRVHDLADVRHVPATVRKEIIIVEQSALAREVKSGKRKAKTLTAAHEKGITSLKRAKLLPLGRHTVDTQADVQRVAQVIRAWIVERTRVAE